MSENERIRTIRKHFHLTLEAFANRLGVNKSSISRLERGEMTLTDRMRKTICLEFRINESWLMTGAGNMLDTDPVDELISKYGLDDFGASLVREYMNLDDNQKAAVQHFFYSIISGKSISAAD